jgi:hypothetical protein
LGGGCRGEARVGVKTGTTPETGLVSIDRGSLEIQKETDMYTQEERRLFKHMRRDPGRCEMSPSRSGGGPGPWSPRALCELMYASGRGENTVVGDYKGGGRGRRDTVLIVMLCSVVLALS